MIKQRKKENNMAKTLAEIIVGMLEAPEGYKLDIWSHSGTMEGYTFHLDVIKSCDGKSCEATIDSDDTIEEINDSIQETVKWMEEGEE